MLHSRSTVEEVAEVAARGHMIPPRKLATLPMP